MIRAAAGWETDRSDAEPVAEELDAGTTRWLSRLFRTAERRPWLLAMLRPIIVRVASRAGPIRRGTETNARRIFGHDVSEADRRRFTRGVVDHFLRFVIDVGRYRAARIEQLTARVETIVGKDRFLEFRQRNRGRGVIFTTAHMGSFEVGLAALREIEPNVHVVFKRDAFESFERMRGRLRRSLGVNEAPIDDGFDSLVRLRDALRDGHAVVMQADRAVPRQRSLVVPFLHGRIALPLGPVRLAALTRSPIVPVYVIRRRDRFRIHLDAPIEFADDSPAAQEQALFGLADSIERAVREHPEQWLVLTPAFVEDEAREDAAAT